MMMIQNYSVPKSIPIEASTSFYWTNYKILTGFPVPVLAGDTAVDNVDTGEDDMMSEVITVSESSRDNTAVTENNEDEDSDKE